MNQTKNTDLTGLQEILLQLELDHLSLQKEKKKGF